MRGLRAALAAVSLVASGLLVPVGEARAATPPSVLTPCHRLTARTSGDRLVNGGFALSVAPDFLEIEQTVPVDGPRGRTTFLTGTWFRDDGTGQHQSNTDKSYLAFHCNGDLSLRTSTNVLLWHTGTANRGGKRLTLTSSGNLVMTTASGRVVWQSRSGWQLMPTNSVLPSRARLTYAWGDQQGVPIETLTMQADGNLVYREGSRVRWQSGTHVAGSHLTLTSTAELRVVTRGGSIVWRSRTRGSSYSVLRLPVLEQFAPSDKLLWKIPHSY
ncbi:hypothetical protein [Oryzihumus sp.]